MTNKELRLLMIWLEERRRKMLSKQYSQYDEGYLDAIMDMQNKIKALD